MKKVLVVSLLAGIIALSAECSGAKNDPVPGASQIELYLSLIHI